jgi:flagellar biosynthesis protein FliQ
MLDGWGLMPTFLASSLGQQAGGQAGQWKGAGNMSPETFVDVFREALWLVTIMVCAVILPSLFVGLLVAIFQAATSINEQTLSFLPRLVVTLLALGAGAHWGLQSLMDFFQLMVSQIPEVVG